MRDPVRILIHLGSGEEGERRRAALQALADELETFGQHGEPSISSLIQRIADRTLEVRKMWNYTSDKYGSTPATVDDVDGFVAGLRNVGMDIELTYHTDGDHERYVDQDGEVILERADTA